MKINTLQSLFVTECEHAVLVVNLFPVNECPLGLVNSTGVLAPYASEFLLI